MSGAQGIGTRLPGVGTTIFGTMTGLARECGAINLSQGYPDFDPPAALLQALGAAALSGHNQYPHPAGLPRLRELLAQQLARHRGVSVDPEHEITVVPGATEGIYCAITAVVRPGDEVIVLDPVYDSYEPAVTLAGGRTVHVPLMPGSFAVDWDRVRAAITPRTRLFMLNSPHNPCGSTVTPDDLDTLAGLAERHAFLVCSDEVYEHLVFDGRTHHSVLQHPGLRARSFAHYSFGKTYGVTGWKTGYCVAPPALTAELRKVHQYVAFVAVTPVQHAVAEFIEAHPDYPRTLAADYQARRTCFLEALGASRLRFSPAAGTYFQLLDYSEISDEPDTVLCERWTRDYGVASIPISVFQRAPPPGQRLLRFCFAKTHEVLREAGERLCAI